MELWNNIILDIKDTLQYLPTSLLAGWLTLLVFPFYRKKQEGSRRFIALVFLVVYIAMMLQVTFFCREPGSRQGIDPIPFSTWGDNAVAHAYVIENIILFVPFGFLIGMTFPQFRKFWWTFAVAFIFSCGLELTQLMTKRGYCQVDDVITNVVGDILGWLLCWCITRLGSSKKKGNDFGQGNHTKGKKETSFTWDNIW